MSDEEKKVEEQAPDATPETTQTSPEAPPEAESLSEKAPATDEDASEDSSTEDASTEESSTEAGYVSKLDDFNELKPGQTIRLHERIKDISPKGEERERIQVFEGIILAMGGSGISRTITLRKVSKGFGVEKIYPINSPVVAKIELVKSAKVRRAKLNYLKNPKRRFKRKLKETLTALGSQSRKKKRK
jgi:large subunit ribosomal protein L19